MPLKTEHLWFEYVERRSVHASGLSVVYPKTEVTPGIDQRRLEKGGEKENRNKSGI